MMSKNVGRYIQLGAIVLLLAVFIIANYFINFYKGIIDQYLGGFYGVNETMNPEDGDAVVQKIGEDGFTLLKNDRNTLPLKNVNKINLFGWSSSKEGMLMCGSGSGDFTMVYGSEAPKDVVGLQAALEGLEELHSDEIECNGSCGFAVNPNLVKFYEDYCTVNRNGGTDGRDGWANYSGNANYFNLVEPAIGTYPQELLDDAKAFSKTAAIVITRTGGESTDLPKFQRIFSPNPSNPADAYRKPNQSFDPVDARVTIRSDRTYLQLSIEEEGMINYVKSNFENVIVILNTSATLECGFIDDPDIDAAIYIATPGQSGLVALANILRGNVNPSGKLVDTWAYDLKTAANWATSPDADISGGTVRSAFAGAIGVKRYTGSPVNSGNTGNTYIDYTEGIYVGYRWYETADKTGYWDSRGGYNSVVTWPFGHGLSYTTFDWSVRSTTVANNAYITDKTEITIAIDVTNKGSVAGKDTIQVYYEPEYYPGGIEKSSANLVAFAKTGLIAPGATQTVDVTFRGDDMKSYDYRDANKNDHTGYELEHGDYLIKLSTDSHTPKAGANGSGFTNGVITFKVASDIKITQDIDTEYTVENRFTGAAAQDGGISIDGSNSGQNIQYLSRENFAGTMVAETTARRAAPANLKRNDFAITAKDTNTMPMTNSGGSLRLVSDGEFDWNLINRYGDPEKFDDPAWKDLLDQMSVQEMIDVVMKGGYRAWGIPSVGKPTTIDMDGPAGFNAHPHSLPEATGFPSAIIVASTWDTNIAYYYGNVIGVEGSKIKRPGAWMGWYAPGVNTHRSPFSGRNYEYFSEDGFIAGMIGGYIVKGALDKGVYSYVKHFAVNDAENNRSGLHTWLTEQALREIYLKPFELCVKVGKANAIMSSYNRVGDTWAGSSYALLTEVLRNEWGFKGTVVTDYIDGSLSGKEHFRVDQGIRAGNDIWLENGNDATPAGLGFTDSNNPSATTVRCIRDAAKNVIYTYANTIKTASDAGTEVGTGAFKEVMSPWKYGWIFGDIFLFAGLAVWAFFVLRKLIPALMRTKKAAAAAGGVSVSSGDTSSLISAEKAAPEESAPAAETAPKPVAETAIETAPAAEERPAIAESETAIQEAPAGKAPVKKPAGKPRTSSAAKKPAGKKPEDK